MVIPRRVEEAAAGDEPRFGTARIASGCNPSARRPSPAAAHAAMAGKTPTPLLPMPTGPQAARRARRLRLPCGRAGEDVKIRPSAPMKFASHIEEAIEEAAGRSRRILTLPSFLSD